MYQFFSFQFNVRQDKCLPGINDEFRKKNNGRYGSVSSTMHEIIKSFNPFECTVDESFQIYRDLIRCSCSLFLRCRSFCFPFSPFFFFLSLSLPPSLFHRASRKTRWTIHNEILVMIITKSWCQWDEIHSRVMDYYR